jgi:hypothetical protein
MRRMHARKILERWNNVHDQGTYQAQQQDYFLVPGRLSVRGSRWVGSTGKKRAVLLEDYRFGSGSWVELVDLE